MKPLIGGFCGKIRCVSPESVGALIHRERAARKRAKPRGSRKNAERPEGRSAFSIPAWDPGYDTDRCPTAGSVSISCLHVVGDFDADCPSTHVFQRVGVDLLLLEVAPM